DELRLHLYVWYRVNKLAPNAQGANSSYQVRLLGANDETLSVLVQGLGASFWKDYHIDITSLFPTEDRRFRIEFEVSSFSPNFNAEAGFDAFQIDGFVCSCGANYNNTGEVDVFDL